VRKRGPPGWGSGRSQDEDTVPQPSPLRGASQHLIPGPAQKGRPRRGQQETGPQGWGGPQEKQVSTLPLCLPGKRGGPRCQHPPSPYPGSATHLPEPAAAHLLQVQEAVPAQVCGPEELHCDRAGGSGTQLGLSLPPSALPGPLQRLPTQPVQGSCPKPPRVGPRLGTAIRSRVPVAPGSRGPASRIRASFWVGLGRLVPKLQGHTRLKTTGPGAKTGAQAMPGGQCGRGQAGGEEGTRAARPLTPATGWHSSTRLTKGSFVGGCLAQPRTEHTGPILLQPELGEVSREEGSARAPEEGPGLPSPLTPRAPGIPRILLPRQPP